MDTDIGPKLLTPNKEGTLSKKYHFEREGNVYSVRLSAPVTYGSTLIFDRPRVGLHVFDMKEPVEERGRKQATETTSDGQTFYKWCRVSAHLKRRKPQYNTLTFMGSAHHLGLPGEPGSRSTFALPMGVIYIKHGVAVQPQVGFFDGCERWKAGGEQYVQWEDDFLEVMDMMAENLDSWTD